MSQKQQSLRPSELSFETVRKVFVALRDQTKKGRRDKKDKILKAFIKQCIWKESKQAFDVFRLFLPALDRERGNFFMKEQRLVDVVCKAANVSKTSFEYTQCKNWKHQNVTDAGDLPGVLKFYVFTNLCSLSDGNGEQEVLARKKLKVGELNSLLDKLVEGGSKVEPQVAVFQALGAKTSPDQLAWITRIILKSMKINASEKTIFAAWHDDAETFYNQSGMNLKQVFNELIDPNKSYRTEIEPGRPVRPQMAQATSYAHYAFQRMKSKEGLLHPFCIETKYDGERIQVHKCPNGTLQYFSRRAIEHGERSSYDMLDKMFKQQIVPASCILDGELVVWNKARKVFEPFGILKPAINAIKEKLQPNERAHEAEFALEHLKHDRQAFDYEPPLVKDMELLFICFDVLHNGEGSVMHKPLSVRQQLLKQIIRPSDGVTLNEGSVISGRVVPLIPDETRLNGWLCSRTARTAKEIEEALQEATQQEEEGVVIKNLDSTWRPNDRSGEWLKIKPDYINGLDLDCLIVGGWWGQGSRNKLLSQFLLALRETNGPDSPFVTFCRVGTGMNEEERESVNERLRGNWTDVPSRVPAGLKISKREKPDCWVVNLQESVVLQVHADVRMIISRTFASGDSLRFPRITDIRWDKAASNTNSLEDVRHSKEEYKNKQVTNPKEELAKASQAQADGKKAGRYNRKVNKPAKKRAKLGHATIKLSDTSDVKVQSDALAGCNIVFLNYGNRTKQECEAMVRSLGGTTWLQWVPKVTHIIAARNDKAVELQAKADRDVICLAWLEECAAAGGRVPPRARHYLHMSTATRQGRQDVDPLGDSYYDEVSAQDVINLMGQMDLESLDVAELADELAEGDEGAAAAAAKVAQKDGDDTVRLLSILDAAMAGIGQLDARFAALRGCTVAFLQLSSAPGKDRSSSGGGGGDPALFPPTAAIRSAAAASAGRLLEVQQALLAQQVQLHGGQVAASISPGVTHVVALLDEVSEQQPGPLDPAALLLAVRQQAGGAAGVQALQRGLANGTMTLAAARWLERCFEQAELLQATTGMHLPSAAPNALPLSNTDIAAWPWAEFGTKYKPASPVGPAPVALPRPRRRGKALGGRPPSQATSAGAAPSATAATMRAEAAAEADAGEVRPRARRLTKRRAATRVSRGTPAASPGSAAPAHPAPAPAPMLSEGGGGSDVEAMESVERERGGSPAAAAAVSSLAPRAPPAPAAAAAAEPAQQEGRGTQHQAAGGLAPQGPAASEPAGAAEPAGGAAQVTEPAAAAVPALLPFSNPFDELLDQMDMDLPPLSAIQAPMVPQGDAAAPPVRAGLLQDREQLSTEGPRHTALGQPAAAQRQSEAAAQPPASQAPVGAPPAAKLSLRERAKLLGLSKK